MKTEEKLNPALLAVERNEKKTAKESDSSAFTPFRPQTILVPVEDSSACSKKAIQYAIPFARELNARILLLRILPARSVPEWKCDPDTRGWFLDTGSQQKVEAYLSRLAQEIIPAGIPATACVRYGNPSTQIINAAKEMDVDLIIMSTHSYKGLTHFLIGSVASRVTRLAPCPVLVVREHEHEFSFSQRSLFNHQ